jgi:predicted RNase H-like nuclease (RuvC/YqgF family)
MPDPKSDDTVDNNSDVNKETPGGKPDNKDSQIENLNVALRSERSVIKDLRKEVDAVKDSQLEEQGKFKELYETQKTEFEALKSQMGEYETHFTDALEGAKGKVDPNVLELLPNNLSNKEQLSWLEKAAVLSNEKPKQRPDATRGQVNPAGDDNKVSVSQEEFMNMTPEERSKMSTEDIANLKGLGGLRMTQF